MTGERTAGSGGDGPRVLVVEDEAPLAQVVASYFTRESFQVRTEADGPGAVAVARQWAPDLIVLDVGLPGIDGLEVCRQVRTFSDCYVLMLTARSDEVDTLVGLTVGADDYMTKPFSPRELVARARALLRRPRTGLAGRGVVAGDRSGTGGADSVEPPLVLGGLTVDVEVHEVSVDGEVVTLTPTEYDILLTLLRHPRRVFTRSALISAVWGDDYFGDEHLVDVHIAHLRRKLGDDATSPAYVRTVRGVGYRLGAG